MVVIPIYKSRGTLRRGAFVSVDNTGFLQGILLEGAWLFLITRLLVFLFLIPVKYDEFNSLIGLGQADVPFNDGPEGVFVFFKSSMELSLVEKFHVIRGVGARFLMVPSVHGSSNPHVYLPIHVSTINEDLGSTFQFSMGVSPEGEVRESSSDEGADGGVLISLEALTLSI